MKILKIILLSLASCLCFSADANPPNEGPFSGIDLRILPRDQAKAIQEASEDFALVMRGRKPRHASFDKDAPLPTDGGTTYYLGRGYQLTICHSIASFGDLSGYSYGPIVTFDSEFATGDFSAIRFYTSEQLEALKSELAK